ncbi:PREDICTED: histone-lysine N-methyltransferase, H3 lysine-9 specific SUVH7-like isoform X2 [Brassica oleracea var. oleracea]|uniref:histone-lysine N-methyltransferase, H3 lysine-9 specific SUVH7-like isoform X2 n=1 Tax=Brassica oleracea var. oleracea TaxID=109376 RepID=UPI0006A6C179|nr:PREDICTED: histone-lysine N-methyltransferase, H3 lysine-9 specific SUVH7-like isoform X2 [Brassica oleracea var. oleracea]
MSPSKTKGLRSWSVESDDDNNPIENISSPPTSLMVSPFRFFDDETYYTTPYLPSTVSSFQTIIDEAIFDETYNPTTFYPLIDSPLQTLDDQTYNITSPSTLEVGPLQTVDDENHNPKTPPPPPLEVPPLPTIDGETHKAEPPLPTLEITLLQTVDDENHNPKTPPPTLEVPPLPTTDGETHKAEPPLPTLEITLPQTVDNPLPTIDGEADKAEPPLPTLEITLPQTVDNNINNTPPPTLEVPPLPTIDGETHKEEPPLPTLEITLPQTVDNNINNTPPPTLEVSPLPTIDGETHQAEPLLPTLEITLLQTVDNSINNTPAPPLMVSSLQAIVPYETNKDSIAAADGPSSGAIKRKRGRPRGSKNSKMAIKKPKPYDSNSKVVTSCPSFDTGISEAEGETGNKEVADSVLMRFDAVRRRLCQLKCFKGPLLQTALANCKNLGVRTNRKKRIGSIPGVNVGDIFYFWGEMSLVGLHMLMVAGIDYLTIKDGATEGPLATSVVTSGHYDDETEDTQTLIYTGHGGKTGDQELRGGNSALKESKLKGNEVRVIRGEEDPNNKGKNIYIYDGLYIVSDSWEAKGKSGFKEFKFKLLRKPDQPAGYANWKSSKNWSKCTDNSRKGLILQDLSYGAETLPVPLVNEIDENDKEMPQDFSYVNSSTCPSMTIVQNYQSTACIDCHQVQLCEGPTCICVQRNGGDLPYHNRILVCRKPMVYECGDMCPCPPDCHNRLTQTGLKIRVEVFKTEKCGWGLRSLEPIRAGTFICQLVGMAKRIHDVDEDDEYVFDSSRVYNQFKWNYEPELVGEDCWDQVPEAYKLRWRMVVSSKAYGNVSRFMNHSCSPNVMWQPVEYEDSRQPCVRIAFFAMKHIPPLTELRYDYGMSCRTEELGEDGKTIFKGKKICHCGSVKCQGSFG